MTLVHRLVSLIDTDHRVGHNAVMSQPFPPSQVPPASSASGRSQETPAQSYGRPSGIPSPSTSPYTAYAHGSSPRPAPPVDYPYLQGQTATPTRPVPQHLSSVGQPASRIVSGAAGTTPSSVIPTATFPRSVPVTPSHPIPAAPQPSAQPRLVQEPSPSITRQTAPGLPVSWQRDRIIALIVTLVACILQIIWTCIDASEHPSFHTDRGFTPKLIIELVFYILYTLGAWWLLLLFFSLRAIHKNKSSAVIVAAALQLLLIDVLVFNNDIIGNPLPILCLLATGSAAIATVFMNQRTPSPSPWPVTLGLAINLFILVSMLHRLMRSALYAFNDNSIRATAVGLWMIPSPSNEFPGTPYALGVLLTVVIAIFSAVALRFGYRPSRRSTFAKLCGIGPMLVALHNICILSIFGMTGTSIIAALGFTSVGQGGHPYATFRTWVSSILLGLIATAVAVLLHRSSSTDRRMQALQGTSPTGPTATPRYQRYHPHTR